MTLDFYQSFSVREGLKPSKLPSGSLSLRLDTDFILNNGVEGARLSYHHIFDTCGTF